MTNEDAIKILNTVLFFGKCDCPKEEIEECLKMAIQALESYPLIVPIAGIKYEEDKIKELISKCVLTVTPQEPFINKPCVSKKVCEHDKNKVLDKIRAEIELNAYPIVHGVNNHELGMTLYGILQVIDKYKAESEET